MLDKAYFESIKSDKVKALDYLQSCGITWKSSSHAGINWMHAMQAFQSALGGQNGAQVNSQNNPNQHPQTAQNAQNSQPKGQNSPTVTLTPQQQAEVDAGRNGKEKVVILKKLLGRAGCMDYARSLGVTWAEDKMDAINNMRMSVALTKHFDSKDGTVSPTGGKGSKDKGGAPKGNQNAAKPDSDKLDIPANAPEYKKNIVKAINNITDVDQLQTAIDTGMVPEDSVAADFIKSTLYKEYETKLKKPQSQKGTYAYYHSSSSSLRDSIVDATAKMFTGLPKKSVNLALDWHSDDGLLSDKLMQSIMYPREFMAVQSKLARNNLSIGNTCTLSKMLAGTRVFGGYASESVIEDTGGTTTCNNIGYYGCDSKKYAAQFDVNKEGFVKILRHIAAENPDLKPETDAMEVKYQVLMEKCGYNAVMLETILDNSGYGTSNMYEYYQKNHEEYKRQLQAFDTLKDYLKQQGLSDDELKFTLTHGSMYRYKGTIKVYNKDGWGGNKLDANGNQVEIDISNLTLPNSSDKIIDTIYSNAMEDMWNGSYYNAFSTPLTKDEYDDIVERAYDLMGVKLVDKTTGAEPTMKHSDMLSSDYSDLTPVPESENKKLDSVIANMYLILAQNQFKGHLRDYANRSPDSKANKNGTDYNGNYAFYSPDSPRSGWTKGYAISAAGKNSLIDSVDKENEIVQSQLDRTQTYSSDYFEQLRQYAEHDGDKSFTQDYWDTKFKTPKEAAAHSIAITAQKFSINNSNPAMNLLMDQMADAAQYCPQNYNSRVKTADVCKTKGKEKIGHVRFTIPNYSGAQAMSAAASNLKSLRERALAAAHCTLASTDQAKREEVEHEVKIKFDRVDSKGKRVPKPDRVYDDRTLVFHSGVYEIKNTEMDEEFKKESQRIGETPTHAFHGTSYSGACGILGVDGRFRYKDSDKVRGQKGSGSMLGEGIYVAKMVGKNCPYIGSDPYTYMHYTANDTTTPNNAADGVVLVCDTIYGKYGEFMDSNDARRNNKNNGGSYDSVAVGAGALMPGGGKLKEYECIVTRQNMISPKYIVDCGARRR